MYESFYGFTEKPFALSPDPQFLYLAEPHRRALTMLEYSLANEAPFCLITGEVGSGKTTLIRHLLKKVEQTTTVGLISNTSLNFGRLLQWICMSFGLDYDNKDDAVLYGAFSRFLIDEHAKGRKVVLIVDEAQNLGKARLEELRVLSNFSSRNASARIFTSARCRATRPAITSVTASVLPAGRSICSGNSRSCKRIGPAAAYRASSISSANRRSCTVMLKDGSGLMES
jgi:type II secretory pathway predicted ATPase ExeA